MKFLILNAVAPAAYLLVLLMRSSDIDVVDVSFAVFFYVSLVFLSALIFDTGESLHELLFSEPMAYVVFLVASVHFYLTLASLERPVPADYFAALAQVIPVILLTTVVDLRLRRANRSLFVSTVALATLGEACCLFSLALSISWSPFMASVPFGSTVALLFSFLSSALEPAVRARRQQSKSLHRPVRVPWRGGFWRGQWVVGS